MTIEMKPYIIPPLYFEDLRAKTRQLRKKYRHVVLGIKEYFANEIRCFPYNDSGRVVIFAMRFLENQTYQPLLAIYYSMKLISVQTAATYIQLYWQDLIQDLRKLGFYVIMTVSTASSVLWATMEQILKCTPCDIPSGILYCVPEVPTEIIHVFDVSILCWDLDYILFNSTKRFYFLQVENERTILWYKACTTDIQNVCDKSINRPERHKRGHFQILTPAFFYNFADFYRSKQAEKSPTTESTEELLSMLCPYIEFMNTLSLIKVNDLLNIFNSFKSLRIMLATSYVEDVKISLTDEEDEFEYEQFEENYIESTCFDFRARNTKSWCMRLLKTFNDMRSAASSKIHTSLYMKLNHRSSGVSPFNTKLHIRKYYESDNLYNFKNVLDIYRYANINEFQNNNDNNPVSPPTPMEVEEKVKDSSTKQNRSSQELRINMPPKWENEEISHTVIVKLGKLLESGITVQIINTTGTEEADNKIGSVRVKNIQTLLHSPKGSEMESFCNEETSDKDFPKKSRKKLLFDNSEIATAPTSMKLSDTDRSTLYSDKLKADLNDLSKTEKVADNLTSSDQRSGLNLLPPLTEEIIDPNYNELITGLNDLCETEKVADSLMGSDEMDLSPIPAEEIIDPNYNELKANLNDISETEKIADSLPSSDQMDLPPIPTKAIVDPNAAFSSNELKADLNDIFGTEKVADSLMGSDEMDLLPILTEEIIDPNYNELITDLNDLLETERVADSLMWSDKMDLSPIPTEEIIDPNYNELNANLNDISETEKVADSLTPSDQMDLSPIPTEAIVDPNSNELKADLNDLYETEKVADSLMWSDRMDRSPIPTEKIIDPNYNELEADLNDDETEKVVNKILLFEHIDIPPPIEEIIEPTYNEVNNIANQYIQCTCYLPSTSKYICPLFNVNNAVGDPNGNYPETPINNNNEVENSSILRNNTEGSEEINLFFDPIDFSLTEESEGETDEAEENEEGKINLQSIIKRAYRWFPASKKKFWLFRAWLSTLYSFQNLHNKVELYKFDEIHVDCFNLNHIDHYVNRYINSTFTDVQDSEDTFHMFAPTENICDILEKDLIHIEPELI